MRKVFWVTTVLLLSVFLFSGEAQCWQGRMSGMGDPFGLVADESDLLIHPAMIANIKTQHVYGDYRFTYTNIDTSWGGHLSRPTTVPLLNVTVDSALGRWNSNSNDQFQHDALLGFVAPAGSGTGGIFVTYRGVRSDFDGDMSLRGAAQGNTGSIGSVFSMERNIDDFAVKGIYGMPISGDLKWGGELQFGYHREENKTFNSLTSVIGNGTEFIGTATFFQKNDFWGLLFPFMMPKDDEYWEFSAKTGIEGTLGPASIGVTVRGGAFFAGDSKWKYLDDLNVPAENVFISNDFDLGGGVDGWKAGGDIWVRVPYSSTVTLPFILRMDYVEKNRDGNGTGLFDTPTGVFILPPTTETLAYSYSGSEKLLDIETGGGVDIQMNPNLKLAAGLYYNYTNSKQSLSLVGSDPALPILFVNFDYAEYPETTQHLVRFKLAAEQQYSPTCQIRGGLQLFGGFMEESYSFRPNVNDTLVVLRNDGDLDGSRWGVTGSLGATFQLQGGYVLEPFIQAGYQDISLSDNSGLTSVISFPLFPWHLERDRSEVMVAVGASIRF